MAQTATSITVVINSTSARNITLASVTNLTVGMLIQIDNEFMVARAINTTSLIVTVDRGVSSKATQHGVNSPAYFGSPADFGSVGASYMNPNYTPKYFDTLAFPRMTPTAQLTTAAAITYTSGQLLGGLILRDPNGAARADLVPTAVLLIAAMPGCEVGTFFEFIVQNDADAAETITLTTATGATMVGTMTIAQSNSKTFRVRITNITPGSEAYTVYNRGTYTS